MTDDDAYEVYRDDPNSAYHRRHFVTSDELRRMALRAKETNPDRQLKLFDAHYRRQRSRGIYG